MTVLEKIKLFFMFKRPKIPVKTEQAEAATKDNEASQQQDNSTT